MGGLPRSLKGWRRADMEDPFVSSFSKHHWAPRIFKVLCSELHRVRERQDGICMPGKRQQLGSVATEEFKGSLTSLSFSRLEMNLK